MEKMPKIGDVVIFHDNRGVAHNALVTCVWSATMVNLVIISADETRKDEYGRQIERPTSVGHVSLSSAHGYYFRWPEEEPRPYVEPVAL